MSRSHRTPYVLLVVVLLFFGLTISVHANLYHVDAVQGMDTNDGSTWGDAFETQQKALAVAAMIPPPHLIKVAAAGTGKAGATTYRPDEGPATPFERDESFMMLPKTILIGGFLNGGTVSDPNNNITILSGDLAGNDGPGFMGYDENSLHVLRFVENPLAPGDEGSIRVLDAALHPQLQSMLVPSHRHREWLPESRSVQLTSRGPRGNHRTSPSRLGLRSLSV